ncbi:hypothetical protein AYJ54_12235 [Bradyrhizobium centrolobii]|uniref:Uncharacterized protein n=1 Tax=Bradyrhizobium centrolobii TaxID=1505087 RepID=A0A176YSY6_9BRAD|nr:hypothetical protein AYJ54_12235 [Bradyrhizobium centrolobii]
MNERRIQTAAVRNLRFDQELKDHAMRERSQKCVMGEAPGYAIVWTGALLGWIHRGAVTMTRSIVVGLAILTLSLLLSLSPLIGLIIAM